MSAIATIDMTSAPRSALAFRLEANLILKLKEKYADNNPFKFIVYSSRVSGEAAK